VVHLKFGSDVSAYFFDRSDESRAGRKLDRGESTRTHTKAGCRHACRAATKMHWRVTSLPNLSWTTVYIL